jgi:tetratricopeptide (TPR) repeat protein
MSMTTLADAIEEFRAGRLQEAEGICRQLVEREPGNPAALHLLGVLAHQAGRNNDAVELISRAVTIESGNAEFHYNLGVALQMLARNDEAAACYRQALRLAPARAEAHNNLGYILLRQEHFDDAVACFEQALRLRPDYAEAQHNRGDAFNRRGLQLLKEGQLDAARHSFEQAVRDIPADPDAHNNLGAVFREQGRPDEAAACFYLALALRPEHAVAHNNLGRVCEDRGRLDEAAARYRLAICYHPGNAVFHNNLGNALTMLSRPEEALTAYQQAVRLQPGEPVFHSNLANGLTLAGRPEEAETCCRQALNIRPDHVDARHNLAITLAAQGKFAEALAHNEEALRLEPEHPGARNCRALWRLQHGDFASGWAEYGWRWKVRGVKAHSFREPAWDGSPLDGRTILLYAEQALGDTIQFIRYAPLVKGSGTVIVECQPPLARLLASCPGIDHLVPRGSPMQPFDVQAALLSLPGLLGTTLQTVPANVPYLFADAGLVAAWRQKLEAEPGFRIGIAWQGSPTFAGDRMRSAPLRHFAPVSRVKGVRLFGLQKGPGREQIRTCQRLGVIDLGGTLDETTGAFMDTAAVMKTLDLVVTTDTSVAHLAGALGVPVWVALAVGADWRWLLDREDCPWYPSMRLFRQSHLHDWDEVFERMASALVEEKARAGY